MVPLCGQPLTGAMDSAKKKTRSQCFLPGRLPTFGFRLVGHLTHMGQLGIFFFLLASLLLSEIGLVLLFLTRAFLLAARLFGRHGFLRDVLHHKNLMLIGTVSLRLVPRALRTSAPRYRKWITGSREGRTGEGARWEGEKDNCGKDMLASMALIAVGASQGAA